MAFYDCDNLAEVILPETIKTIAGEAFRDCFRLKKINLPDSIESIGEMAFYGSKIEALVLPKGLTSLGDSAFSSCSLKYIASPEGMSLTTIPTSAFSYCNSLEEVVLPDSVTTIGDYCFRGDDKLKRLVTPTASFGTNHNQSLGQLFDNQASGLEEIIVTGDGVIPEGAFDGANYLTSITFTGNPSSFEKGCLSGVSALENLSLPYLGGAGDDYANTGFLSYLFGGTDPVSDTSFVPSSLTSVEVRGGIIGMNAFTNCEYLKSIIIGKDVTKFDSDDSDHSACQPFKGCSSLEYLEIPYVGVKGEYSQGRKGWLKYLFGEGAADADVANSLPATLETVVVNGGVSIGESAFRKCTYIKNIVIKTTWIDDYAFEGSGIESLVLQDYVFHFGKYACANCQNLTYVKLPENDDLSVLPERAFANTPKLKTVIMSSYIDTIRDRCFEYSGIQHIDLSNIKSLGYGCFSHSNIRRAELSDQLTVIQGGAFEYCEKLESVVIPGGVQTVGSGSFVGCTSLSSLTFNSISDATGTLEIGHNAFEDCYSLSSVVLPNRTTALDSSAFKNCKSLTYVKLPVNLEMVSDHCFDGCLSLVLVENCASNLWIDDYAFYGCASLKYFTTYDEDYASTAGISEIGRYAFRYCSSLETITLNGLTSIHYWGFANSGLKDVVLPDSVTELLGETFYECTSLKSVTLSHNDQMTKIPWDFCYGCTSLEEVVFYDNITEIEGSAFRYTRLTSIVIPETVTAIGNSAFANCYALKDIRLPDTGDLQLGERSFYSCTALEYIRIGAAVTSVGYHCFEGCTYLNTVTFMRGADLTLGYYAFSDTGITTVNTVLSSTDYLAWYNTNGNGSYTNTVLKPTGTTTTTFNYNYVEP